MSRNNLTGFNAADATSNWAIMTYIREHLARVKVFVDLASDKQPRTLDLQKPSKSYKDPYILYNSYQKINCLKNQLFEKLQYLSFVNPIN